MTKQANESEPSVPKAVEATNSRTEVVPPLQKAASPISPPSRVDSAAPPPDAVLHREGISKGGEMLEIDKQQHGPQIASGQTFADFMYAVVIGVAFSDIKLSDSWPALFATLVIIVMIVEDFYMYQTQVKPLVGVFRFWTLRSLLFEMGMLLSWFLAFLSRRESLASAIVCVGIFYFLKWLPSVLRIRTTEKSKRWVLHRDHLYLITVACAVLLATKYKNFLGSYIILLVIWLIQTALWWIVVRTYERRAATTAH